MNLSLATATSGTATSGTTTTTEKGEETTGKKKPIGNIFKLAEKKAKQSQPKLVELATPIATKRSAVEEIIERELKRKR